MATTYDFIIIGGGIFGAAIARALRQWKPDSHIVVFEGTHKDAASRDTDKIIRSTYPDPLYCIWAKQALHRWMEDPVLKDFVHLVTWIRWLKPDSPGDWKGEHDKPISREDMQTMVGSTQQRELTDGEKLSCNKDVGYIDCALAVDAMLIDAKVERVKSNVTNIIVRGDECLGVQADGIIYTTKETTIVAAGPWTPELLDKSGVIYPDNFFRVCGVPVGNMPLAPDDLKNSMPILVVESGGSNLLKQVTCS